MVMTLLYQSVGVGLNLWAELLVAWSWFWILYVGIQPIVHLPEHVENGLAAGVAVGLKGEQYEAHGSSLAFDGAEEAFALDGESAGVVVGFAVDQQDWGFDFVGKGKWRHLVIHFGRLPVGTLFILKAEGGQGAVIGATARDAGLEQIAVSEEVCGHERAVGVAHDCNPVSIYDSEPGSFIDSSFRTGDELFHIGIVRFRLAFTYDGNRRVLEYGVALCGKRNRRSPVQEGKFVGRAGDLSG